MKRCGNAALHALAAAALLLAAGCGTQAKATQSPGTAVWAGPGLMKALAKLPNYAVTESMLEAFNLGAVEYSQTVEHTGASYREDITGKASSLAFMGVTSLVYADNSYYIEVTKPPTQTFQSGWYDLGAKAKGPYSYVMQNFSQINTAWRSRLTGSTATAAGSCTAAGRKGIAWRVKFQLPSGLTAHDAYGTACTDAKTGAPLAIDFTFKGTDANGQAATFSDHLKVTAVGSVATVAAPSGALPAPKVTYAP